MRAERATDIRIRVLVQLIEQLEFFSSLVGPLGSPFVSL